MQKSHRPFVIAMRVFLMVLWLWAGWWGHPAIGSIDAAQAWYKDHYHSKRLDAFLAWSTMMTARKTQSAPVLTTHGFFNQHLRFSTDLMAWGVQDYWATLAESLYQGSGDCEDFVIAKYTSLRLLGIPDDQLRLVYAYVRQVVPRGESNAHMVLAWYPPNASEPLIADNLLEDLLPASRRIDLEPIFSFNAQSIYTTLSASTSKADASRLSRWENVLLRSKQQGVLP